MGIENNPDNDFQAWRCGHNFPIAECPYKFCAARGMLGVIERMVNVFGYSGIASESPTLDQARDVLRDLKGHAAPNP